MDHTNAADQPVAGWWNWPPPGGPPRRFGASPDPAGDPPEHPVEQRTDHVRRAGPGQHQQCQGGDAHHQQRILDRALAPGQVAAGKQDLGPLPTTSVVLLSVIGAAWVLILLYVVWQQLQKSKRGD